VSGRRIDRTVLAAALLAGLALAACEREARHFQPQPPPGSAGRPVRLATLQPGPRLPARDAPSPYENNSFALNEGKRLFEWYNCAGCHFQGGGGIGPALMDDVWLYGANAQNVHDSIVEGRPNGMPSYGGHIPDDDVWKLTAYVRSLSGQLSKPAEPTRSDHLTVAPSEQARKPQVPRARRAKEPG
jgi:cytochrome c oxidase cbb3-type subunit 3